jgi:protein-S-isoprenylcysteine O-methyltransferase Ste14
MDSLDQRILGIAILLLLSMLVTVKRLATGSVLDAPKGTLMVQIVNAFNLCFLLVLNPLVAILLITRRLTVVDPTHITVVDPTIGAAVEIGGAVVYVMGYLIMAGALIALGRSYQLGGNAPRSEDRMIVKGPYRLIRHPMYTAALSISLGLACLIQSWGALCVSGIYLLLVLLLIPMEEAGLRKAYGEAYAAYQHESKKLIPFAY